MSHFVSHTIATKYNGKAFGKYCTRGVVRKFTGVGANDCANSGEFVNLGQPLNFARSWALNNLILPRLTRSHNYWQMFGGWGALMVIYWLTQQDIFSVPVSFWVLGIIGFIAHGIRRRQPVAEIAQNHLIIRNNWSTAQRIPLAKVVRFTWRDCDREARQLDVEYQDGSIQSIVVHDQVEHLEDARLLNFIREHTADIPLLDAVNESLVHSDKQQRQVPPVQLRRGARAASGPVVRR